MSVGANPPFPSVPWEDHEPRRKQLWKCTVATPAGTACAHITDALTPKLYENNLMAYACYFHNDATTLYFYAEFTGPRFKKHVHRMLMACTAGRPIHGPLFKEVHGSAASSATMAKLLGTAGVRHNVEFVPGVDTTVGLTDVSRYALACARASNTYNCKRCRTSHMTPCMSCAPGDRVPWCRDYTADQTSLNVLAELMLAQLVYHDKHSKDCRKRPLWYTRYAQDVRDHFNCPAETTLVELATHRKVDGCVPYNSQSGNLSPLKMAKTRLGLDVARHDALVSTMLSTGKL